MIPLPSVDSKTRIAVLALMAAAALGGCKRKETVAVEQTDEGPHLASIVHTGDPQSDPQLVTGFYDIEQHAWRWTAQRFSVMLHPPEGGAQRGATLTVQFAVPDAVINRLKTVSLSGMIGSTPLSPETYTQPGPYTYTRDVPANLLNADQVRVDFQLDKALPAGTNGDRRELGIIVSSVGLESK